MNHNSNSLFNWGNPPFKEGQAHVFAPPPDVFIDPEAHRLMQALIELNAPKEISGFARVRASDNGLFYVVHDVIYVGGEHSHGRTDITREFEDWITQQAAADADISDIHCWWHSHGDGSVFFSGTDTNTIELKIFAGYVIAIVGNSRGEYRCAFYSYGIPGRPPVMFDSLKYPQFMAVTRKEDYEKAKALIEQHRHRGKILVPSPSSANLMHNSNYDSRTLSQSDDRTALPRELNPIPRFDRFRNIRKEFGDAARAVLPPTDQGDPPPGNLANDHSTYPGFKPYEQPRQPWFDFNKLSIIALFASLFESPPEQDQPTVNTRPKKDSEIKDRETAVKLNPDSVTNEDTKEPETEEVKS